MTASASRRHVLLQFTAVVAGLGLAACGRSEPAASAAVAASAPGAGTADPKPGLSVTVAEARAALAENRVRLIDIREPDEQAQGVAPGALTLPMSQLEQRLSEIPTDPATPVLLICRTQNRSRRTTEALRARGGYANVRYVEGGMDAWVRQGGPVVTPAAR